MESMGAYWLDWFISIFKYPLWIFQVIAFILTLSKFIPDKLYKRWNNRIKNLINIIKKYALYILLGLVLLGIILAPISMYNNEQNKSQQIYQEHRPILNIEPIGATTGIDINAQSIHTVFYINVENRGDRGAYQTLINGFCAPINDPSKIAKSENESLINPIIQGANMTLPFTYSGLYSTIENMAIVLIYIRVKYNNSPEQGIWNQDEFWFSININLSNSQVGIAQVEQKWIDIYKPYVDKIYTSIN
jgi:hypothetical protein